MPLNVLFVSGPRQGGKSTIIQNIIRNCEAKKPHYLRMTSDAGNKRKPAATCPPPRDNCGVASAQWLQYDEDRVFEILPDVLCRLHAVERSALVIIEADSDPQLRYAYPYDHRLFVLPAPTRMTEVFRTRLQATRAFQDTLNDTAAFAREIYGLADDGKRFDDGGSEERGDMTGPQIRELMSSPLGDAMATRILLQPAVNGVLEADVIVVNTAVGGSTTILDRCVRQLQRVLDHVRPPEGRAPTLFACDPDDADDPLYANLYRRLAELANCQGVEDSAAR